MGRPAEETQEQTKAQVSKEIAVNIVVNGNGATEDSVNEALVELMRQKGWNMGGMVKEMTPEEIEDAKKEVDEIMSKKGI